VDKRNIKRLLAVLENTAQVAQARDEDVVIATATPGVPNLTLGDIKDTIISIRKLVAMAAKHAEIQAAKEMALCEGIIAGAFPMGNPLMRTIEPPARCPDKVKERVHKEDGSNVIEVNFVN
jgi:hypothetical protein